MLGGRVAVQKLDRWADQKLMKFKGKNREVIHVRYIEIELRCLSTLGSAWRGGCVLCLGWKLIVRQQCALVAMEAHSTQGCIALNTARTSQQAGIPFPPLQCHAHLFCFRVLSTRKSQKPGEGYLKLKANRIITSFILSFCLYIFKLVQMMQLMRIKTNLPFFWLSLESKKASGNSNRGFHT